jgi:aminoglycoside phosphotransferase (APT) family kinase protein
MTNNLDIEAFVIDWEFIQFGHKSLDLGQMIGDLYERAHFEDCGGHAVPAIRAFMRGYGRISDEVAFRTGVMTGIHLITWYRRRPADGELKAPRETIWSAMTLGMDLIRAGWKGDREWFRGTLFECLFTGDNTDRSEEHNA